MGSIIGSRSIVGAGYVIVVASIDMVGAFELQWVTRCIVSNIFVFIGSYSGVFLLHVLHILGH